jgi:hypothetical protein
MPSTMNLCGSEDGNEINTEKEGEEDKKERKITGHRKYFGHGRMESRW